MKGIRILGVVMSLLLVLSFVGTAFAASYASPDIIEPMYTHTQKIEALLSLSGSTASAAGRITPSGSYDSKVTVQLQRGKDNKWTTIATWTGSCDSGTSKVGGEKAITKGYDYRVKVTGRVYDSDGKLAETVTKYSSTKSY